MLLHIPHSSIKMAKGVKVSNLQENLDVLTDWFTDELFYHPSAEYIIFPYSRLSVDVERYLKDEPMEKEGKGVLYKTDAFNKPIIRDATVFPAMMKIYQDHHYFLNQRAGWTLAYFPIAFIVDCHSFADEAGHPDICLGTGSYTPESVVDEMKKYFDKNGFSNTVNFPYSGSIMPHGFENNKDVKSIMIEVNRKLYLNKYNKNDNFENMQKIIEGALDIIYEHEDTVRKQNFS